MAYTLNNKCAKSCCKRAILVQLIVEDVVTCIFGTQCSWATTVKIYCTRKFSQTALGGYFLTHMGLISFHGTGL